MSIRTSSRVSILAVVAALPLVTSSAHAATPGWSWNLSRDLQTNPASNPSGPWAFMASSALTLPFSTMLPSYSTLCFGAQLTCWYDTDFAMVGAATQTVTTSITMTRGVPLLHPGGARHVAVRWRNPTAFPLDIKILGRITDADPNGGDGVSFSVVRQNGNITLASGSVVSVAASNLDSDTFFATTTVASNQDVYFIVNRGSNYNYDTTELDILITATLNCAATVPISC